MSSKIHLESCCEIFPTRIQEPTHNWQALGRHAKGHILFLGTKVGVNYLPPLPIPPKFQKVLIIGVALTHTPFFTWSEGKAPQLSLS